MAWRRVFNLSCPCVQKLPACACFLINLRSIFSKMIFVDPRVFFFGGGDIFFDFRVVGGLSCCDHGLFIDHDHGIVWENQQQQKQQLLTLYGDLGRDSA